MPKSSSCNCLGYLNGTFTICSIYIYIPPRSTIKQEDLNSLVGQLTGPYLLVGDFNAHSTLWGNPTNNTLGDKIETFIENNDLSLMNDQSATYLHPATGSFTAIDLSLCSPCLYMDFNWNVHNDQCGSDHYPVFISISKLMPHNTIPKWKLQKAKWSEFQSLATDLLKKDRFEGVSDPISFFSKTLIEIATQTIPKSSANPKCVPKPWFNTECLKAVKTRKNALHKFSNEPTTENLNKYRCARAAARRIIKTSKKESWRDYVSQLNSNTPVKKAWNMVRKISGKQMSSSVSYLTDSNGTKYTEKEDIVNSLATAFQKNSSSNNYSEEFQRFKQNAEKQRLNFSSDNTEIYNKEFKMSELLDALSKAHDTATGPDEVHYQFIKHLPNTGLSVLLDIFNDIWVSGHFPRSWKEAIVVPIPKPGKDHTNPTNYRPISLTSCLCKTMERMINSRLVWFLETNKLLNQFQSGFRRGRSTTDHLIRLESLVRDAFVRGNHVVSIFFDLEKAYDTTWKYGILKDLQELGLRGRMPVFIENYLSDRVFKVRLGSTLSELFEQDNGVPQGGILSVILFIIKINKLAQIIKACLDKSLFVDDLSVSCVGRTMRSVQRQLQLCLDRIQQWANKIIFMFSKSKTVCIHFCLTLLFLVLVILTSKRWNLSTTNH